MVSNLQELYTNDEYHQKYMSSKIIIIDEAQFYPDLYPFIRTELSKQDSIKIFIVAGLSGDFNMKPMGQILQLVPLADEIIKLDAYCVFCKDGTKASFTKRLVDNEEQILIGQRDMYASVCRYHYKHL